MTFLWQNNIFALPIIYDCFIISIFEAEAQLIFGPKERLREERLREERLREERLREERLREERLREERVRVSGRGAAKAWLESNPWPVSYSYLDFNKMDQLWVGSQL